MKKSLAILGLLMAISQPVFAQGMYYAPYSPYTYMTGAAAPLNSCSPCSTLKIIPIVKSCVQTCAPVCNPCNPCATGAAVPVVTSAYAVDPDYNPCCCSKRGFWQNFFSF